MGHGLEGRSPVGGLEEGHLGEVAVGIGEEEAHVMAEVRDLALCRGAGEQPLAYCREGLEVARLEAEVLDPATRGRLAELLSGLSLIHI